MTAMIEQQTLAFSVCIIFGFASGIIIDIYRSFRMTFNPGYILLGIIDLIFWLGLCGLLIWLTYYYNDGEVRLYFFLGIFSGIGFYFATISWIILKILHNILCLVKNALDKVIFETKKLVDIICHKG